MHSRGARVKASSRGVRVKASSRENGGVPFARRVTGTIRFRASLLGG